MARTLEPTLARLAARAVVPPAPSGCAHGLSAPSFPAKATMRPMGAVYKLGPGDKLRVNVCGESSVSGEFQVSGIGAVALALMGEVHAIGLSQDKLEAINFSRLAREDLNDPKIAFGLYRFRPFSIFGKFRKSERYLSAENLTILNADATAGGLTYRANGKRVVMRHASLNLEFPLEVTASIAIEASDVLRVGQRHF